MKKLILTFMFILFLPTIVIADDIDLPATGDLWDNFGAGHDFYGQDKPVTDEDFDKAIEQVKDKKNRGFFGQKKRNKNIPKGEEFSQSNETDILTETSENKEEGPPVVSFPVEIRLVEGVLPVGHYQVKGEKDGQSVVLNFYQSQYLMARVPAVETSDDFGEDTISFVKWFAEGDDKVKVIYGSLDFNAYVILDIVQ
ncbi:MAG: hypothetical protein E7Z87_03625 [Cyanobacteria bacterium SIG26]|nr:hypothetical protein [Cyanobacteria bacterium SIG26]